ncbi:hypothetical protein JL720_16558 [Aureococcus anophagefferens]|nr:hypothetical protein JL720_16558 [Aureococcus anophagefferens]
MRSARAATGGARGLQPVVEELNRALLTFRLVVVGGDDWRASEGAAGVVGGRGWNGTLERAGGQGFRAATVAAALARGRTPDKPANGSAAPPSFGDAWAGAVSANMTSAGYDAGLVIVNFTSACGDPAQQKMKTVYGDFIRACGCPFCVRDTNGSYAHPDASAGLADVLWDAPRAFSREGRRFTAHAGVAVAVGGSDDYSLKYDLAFDDDGHPAFVNISHPLWISTAARVDGFTRDVAGDAFDIPALLQVWPGFAFRFSFC